MFRGLTELKWKVTKSRKTRTHFENYVSLIGPSAFVASFMGLLSFKVKSSKFVFWKSHFIYATIIIVLFTIGMIYAAYELKTTYKFRDTVNMWQNYIIIFLGTVVYLTAYANNRAMLKAIQRVSEASYVVPPKICYRLVKIAFMKDFSLIAPVFGYIPVLFKYYNKFPFLLIFYTFIGFFALINLYTNNVLLLSACFKQINESLEKVREILINDEPHLLRRVFHAQKNPMLLAILRSQKKQHLEMSRTVQQLNHAFGSQIEISLFILLLDVVFDMYSYLIAYNDEGMIKMFGYDIIFAILNTIYMFLIVYIVDITRCEMEKVGSNIHRILIHTWDEKMTIELEMFSLQVLQEGNTFTLKGIILDFTYLSQIVCGITTFFLILLQFLISAPC